MPRGKRHIDEQLVFALACGATIDAAAAKLQQDFDAVVVELAPVRDSAPLIAGVDELRAQFKTLHDKGPNQMLNVQAPQNRALVDGIFDAIAPVIPRESIDFSIAWFQSRYGKSGPGGDDAAPRRLVGRLDPHRHPTAEPREELLAELAEVLDEVPGEAVVVVDKQDHEAAPQRESGRKIVISPCG